MPSVARRTRRGCDFRAKAALQGSAFAPSSEAAVGAMVAGTAIPLRGGEATDGGDPESIGKVRCACGSIGSSDWPRVAALPPTQPIAKFLARTSAILFLEIARHT